MKYFQYLGILIIFLFGCQVQKYLAVSDGSRADGTLTLVYEYDQFEKPVVHWEEAKKSAKTKCQSWGYSDAEFFDVGTSECEAYNGYGQCIRTRVTYKCQCTTLPQPTNSTNNEENKSTLGSGTGFALSTDGLIVTNHHVVEGINSISIKGINGDFSKSYKAIVVVEDKNNDLSILKIDDNNFSSINSIPFTIANKSSEVGTSIFCLGYPLRASMGDEIKTTNGIISAKSGFQGDITTYQISAPVQPGNSGGPIFDNNGNLIGIVNAKHTVAENASYAIKSTYLLNLIDLLPSTPKLSTESFLADMPLTKQINILKKFTYIVETK